MKAILLAGDKKGARTLCGVNKAFLSLNGWPLFIHVLAALDRASHVDAIFIIGPRKQLMEAVEKALPTFFFSKKIEVLEQRESLLENLSYAYEEAIKMPMRNGPPALFVPSDIPLVTGGEIDAFISNADMNRFDYCLGVTPSDSLKPFYPTLTRPGIKMAYLYLNDQVYRMNNLHLARPASLLAGPMIQTIYNHRHQKSPWNRIAMSIVLLMEKRAMPVFLFYFLAQAAVLLSRFGLHRFAAFFRRFLSRSDVEGAISGFLGIRFAVVETVEGGAALDIDDETTYKTISSVFLKWHDLLTSHQSVEHCPFEGQCHGAPK
jgi:GTP:adenosylcobinamide-phosphate guanylyltransferase